MKCFNTCFSGVLMALAATTAFAEKTWYPGERGLGGVVVAVNSTGTHGLVAMEADRKSGIGDLFDASDLCKKTEYLDAQAKEYMDWRLPERYELNQLYNASQKGIIGGFERTYYVSATVLDTGVRDTVLSKWLQDFKNGETLSRWRAGKLKVNLRCVRTF